MSKIERTKNATRNIIFGGMLKIYQIVLPFVMRTVMLYTLGIQYLGLNSLFASILQVLNLVELGVGSAMVYSMYKPIVEDDKKKICALMSLYRLYYRVIGIIIAILGMFLLPFIPNLISGNIPENINVYILYLLNLAATVLTYWLFAYKNCLLDAHQRIDVSSKVSLCITTIQYVGQLIILVFIKNYYFYLITALFTQAMNNIVTAVIVNKIYPYYKPKGKLDSNDIKLINGRVRDLFTSKIGAVIVNSSDTIVISSFLGLNTLAIYQNYFFILNAIVVVVSIIFNSCIAGVGNSIIVETKEKNYNDLCKFTFIIAWIAGFCTVCLLCLYQPFMKIWVGEQYELAFSVVICLCIYYFVFEINQLINMYKDAAGMWHEDRFRPLVTAIVNLILNIILVQITGIYGVILSTVLSMLFIGMPWLLNNLFTVLFERSYMRNYIKKLLLYLVTTTFCCIITYYICSFVKLSDYKELIFKGVICSITPNVLFFIAYRKRNEFLESIKILDIITKGKFHLEKYISK